MLLPVCQQESCGKFPCDSAASSQLSPVMQVLKQRADLKLVVMSATLEAEKFQGYFLDAPLMKVCGVVLEKCVWAANVAMAGWRADLSTF